MRSVMKNVMRSVVIVVSLLLFFTAQAGAGLINPEAPHVFAEYFDGAPVAYTAGTGQILDQGVTGTSGQFDCWGDNVTIQREADASSYLRITGNAGVGWNVGVITKGKFAVASGGTEYNFGGWAVSDIYAWNNPRMGLWGIGGSYMEIYFRPNDRQFRMEGALNNVAFSTPVVSGTGLNQTWHSFSLVLDTTTIMAYVDGFAVDLNGAAEGLGLTHEIYATTLSAGFSPSLNGVPTAGQYARLNSIEIRYNGVYDCQQVWDDGYGKAADINNDCHVDLEDFAKLASQWMQCNNPDQSKCFN